MIINHLIYDDIILLCLFICSHNIMVMCVTDIRVAQGERHWYPRHHRQTHIIIIIIINQWYHPQNRSLTLSFTLGAPPYGQRQVLGRRVPLPSPKENSWQCVCVIACLPRIYKYKYNIKHRSLMQVVYH